MPNHHRPPPPPQARAQRSAAPGRFHTRAPLHAAALALLFINAAGLASPQFILITAELEAVPVKLISVQGERIHYTAAGEAQSSPFADCIALLRDRPSPRAAAPDQGMLRLVDGRQFPGEAATPATPAGRNAREVFAWHSNWLGRMDVRLDEIDWIAFARGPAGPPAPGQRADAVLLANGDRLEGFVTSIREKIELEIDDDGRISTMQIPLERIAAVNMISTPRAEAARGRRRAWLADGTIMDVTAIDVDDGGVARLTRPGSASTARLDARHLAAVALSPGRMIPLASLEPRDVSGPETRYEIPEPRIVDAGALLGLSPLEYRGPLRVEYAVPPGATRFAAEAVLPEASRQWGDFTLIVRDGDASGREVFRERLNAANPRTTVNVPITERSLTIELAEGPHGAVQNHVILHRAMVRVE